MTDSMKQTESDCLKEAELTYELGKLGWVALVSSFLLVCTMFGIRYFISDGAFFVQARALLTRLSAFLLSLICLLGATLAFERITPHNYLHIISEDPKACAILLSSFIAAVAFVIAWIF